MSSDQTASMGNLCSHFYSSNSSAHGVFTVSLLPPMVHYGMYIKGGQ